MHSQNAAGYQVEYFSSVVDLIFHAEWRRVNCGIEEKTQPIWQTKANDKIKLQCYQSLWRPRCHLKGCCVVRG